MGPSTEKPALAPLPYFTREILEQASKEQLIDIVLALQEQNRLLREENAQLKARVQVLEARVEELERKLGMNSQNSSKPPSSDPPWKRLVRGKKNKSGKKPGGQPGHEPHLREFLPVEEVDVLKVVKCEHCQNCGNDLAKEVDPNPQRFQWAEIPVVKPEVHETQVHSCTCGKCGFKNTPEVPVGTPTGAFGPSVQALVSVLSSKYRQGKRSVVEMLWDLFGLTICLGSVSACEKAASQALETPVNELAKFAQRANWAHADETSWKERAKRFWLWVVATPTVAVFLVRARRSTEVAKELLGDFAGVLVTDRYGAYGFYAGLRQWCWAHLQRDFTAMSEREGEAGRIGRELLRCTKKMFRWWHWVRDGTWTREKFKKRMVNLRIEIGNLLIDGELCNQQGVSSLCKRLLKDEDHLWTFIEHEGVEPTNNAAERIIRHAVLWRKICLGTQSEAGSRFVERMLTTIATCKLQHRNVLEFVTKACQARMMGTQAPSLLPASA